MDLDVIEITTPTVVSDAIGDVAIGPIEIPYAVSTPGGSSLLQTCIVYNPSANDCPMDVFISNTSSGWTTETDASGDVLSVGAGDWAHGDRFDSDANVLTVLGGVQCFFNTGTGTSMGSADKLSFVSSIGAPCKAAAGSTSLYLWAIATSTGDPNAALTIKLGFVKD